MFPIIRVMGFLTSRNISVQLDVVVVTVQRLDIDVEVRKDQRLTHEIIGSDRRHKSHGHFYGVIYVECKDAFSSSILKRRLLDIRRTAWSTEPGVGGAIDTDQASPSGDLIAVRSSVRKLVNMSADLPPENRPFAGQVPSVAAIFADVQPGIQIWRPHSEGDGWWPCGRKRGLSPDQGKERQQKIRNKKRHHDA
jgi:hypothetical protein